VATADSIIRVAIVADAKKLQSGFKDADKATGGFLKTVGKVGAVIGGAAVVGKAFDFIGGALANADAVGDAMARLEFVLGKTDAAKLHDMADDFTKMGLSTPKVLALEGAFAGIGTAIGLNKDTITDFADDVVIIADKLSDIDPAGRDAAFFVDAIGKAAGGATKPLKDLNISVDEGAVVLRALHDSGKDNPKMLTDSEKAAARFQIIMEKLNPVLQDNVSGTKDLADKQDELKSKFDNAMTRIGEGLQGPLADLLTWFADEIDAIGPAMDGWVSLGLAIHTFGQDALNNLGPVEDALRGLGGIAQSVATQIVGAFGGSAELKFSGGRRLPNGTSESRTKTAVRRFDERNGYKAFIP
jgi:hypothetical protein